MKGYNISGDASVDSIRELAAQNVQLWRVHICWGTQGWPIEGQWPSYTSQLEGYIRNIKINFLPNLSQHTKIIINVIDAPGGVDNRRRLNCLKNDIYRIWLVNVFGRLASEFKDDPRILGYSLNEPGGDAKALRGLMISLWSKVSIVNDEKIFCVTNSFGQPGNFDEILYIDAPNVWYEVHCYEPMSFTHQGVGKRSIGRKYPSLSFGRRSLERRLRPVTRFWNKHPSANIFIGEFSASESASPQSRLNYVRDCVNLFHSYGFHWCFHAWGSGHPWTPDTYIKDFIRSYGV